MHGLCFRKMWNQLKLLKVCFDIQFLSIWNLQNHCMKTDGRNFSMSVSYFCRWKMLLWTVMYATKACLHLFFYIKYKLCRIAEENVRARSTQTKTALQI